MTSPSLRDALGSATGLRRAVAGALVAAVCIGVAGPALAGSSGYRGAGAEDFNAYAGATPDVPGASLGNWRFGIFHRRNGCDKSYPMHESSPCGSPTGGPVGGMGS